MTDYYPPLTPPPKTKTIPLSMFAFLFSTVFAASSFAAPARDIPESHRLSEYAQTAITRKIFDISEDNRFRTDDPLTRTEFKQALQALACRAYTLRTLPSERLDESWLPKSEIVSELAFLLRQMGPKGPDGNLDIPPHFEGLSFLDLKGNESFEKDARLLWAFGILEAPLSYFGTPPNHPTDPNNPDPLLSRIEVLELLTRMFEIDECGFELLEDRDHDLVSNKYDFCPDIPAPKTPDGCPDFVPYREHSDHRGKVQVFIPKESPDRYIIREKTEIRPGDIFLATIRHPLTGEVYSRSKLFPVTR